MTLLHDVWMEGYAATGERSKAICLARGVRAGTFREAATKVGERLEGRGWGQFDPDRLTVWGCRMFPTEQEARRSFG